MGTIIPYDKMNKVVEKNKNYDELLFTDSDLFGEIKETEGINISVFFLSAIIFTLTKFIYSKDVCITILTIKDGSLIKTILSKIINTNITVKRFYNEINSEINKFSDKEVVDFPVFQYYYQSMDDNDLNIPESDFTIVINEREIRFVYNSNLYSENLIKLFYNSLILILKKFLGDKNIHLRNIALMEFNIDHSFKTQEIQLVNELFEKIVTENKDKLALVATDRSLTFDELNNKANRIANHLIKRGLKIEDRVIINLFRGSNLIVAIIGVVKSGGTLIITDPEYPKERLSFIKKDTKAKFIINENNIKDFLNEIDDENPIVNLKPENMFSIVYTSGSTGVPKGVLVTNRSLVNIFNSFDFEKWKFLLNFNQTFMPFMEFLLLSLYYGGTIVLANNEELFNPVHLFKNHSFDVLAMTPSRLEEYIDNEEISSKLKDVKRIYLLGEKLRAILVEKLRKITHSEIYHLYGSSETGSTNIKLINDINTQNFGDISVGKPVFGVLEKVLDIDDNPLPSLIIGQLMVGGSISNGYWNDTKLTNEKFVEINAIPFFKTGDLGKYDENGNYSIIGRLDNQIKLRGQRIDPGEIENNVPDDIGVEKAIVTVNNENYNQVLALYFTTRSKTLKKDEIIKIKKGIKNHLLGKLPGFMVPQDYVYLEEFPKTSTGKVNVKDLKDYDGNIDEIVKPSNPLEQGIFDLSVELLGYDNFGVTNSLISIGFTSLSIIRLLNKILEKYQIELKLKDLINDNVSIKGLSKLIEKSTVVSYGKHELRDFYPLTSQQFGVYYDSSLNEDKIMYNIPGVLRLDNADVFRVKETLDETIKLHSYLNTELIDVDGVIYQKPSAKECNIVIHDRLPTEEDKKEFVKPFKLHNELLYGLELYYDNVGGVVFVFFDFHHVLIDGESLNCFIDDFLRGYNGESLSSEEFTTYDLAMDEEEYLNSKEYLIDGDFFKRELGSFDGELTVPSDKSNYLGYGKEKNQRISLNKNIVDVLSKKLNITPNICFLSALSLGVSKFTNNRQVLFSTIFNQRDSRYYNSLCMMVKTIPLVLNIDYCGVLKDFIKEVNDQYWMTLEHSKYPFSDIVKDNNLKSEILYAYQDNLFTFNEDNIYFESLSVDNVSKFKLEIEIQSLDDSYTIDVKYDSDFYSDYIINSFINFIKSILFSFKENLNQSLTNLDFLDNEEKELLLNELNSTFVDNNPDNLTVVDLFEENVQINPDKVALVYKDEELTYSELNTMVNKLANYLTGNYNCGGGFFVPLVLDRSLYMIISILAVLKTGCAYVPISPNYPKSRIKHILDDVNAEFILTDNQNHEYISGIMDDNDGFLVLVDVETLFSSSVLDDVSSVNLNKDIGLSDPVYVIYTSGSTGKPKGVVIEHKGLFNTIYIQRVSFETLNKNILLFADYTLDAFISELFMSITSSSTLHLLSDEIRHDFHLLREYIDDYDVNIGTIPPALLNDQDLLRLDTLIVAGDKTRKKLINLYLDNNIRVFNAYGPTEDTICSTFHKHNEKDKENNIGKPISNTTVYSLKRKV